MNSEKQALSAIKDGHVILHNTDTVPGLACSALNPKAISAMRQVKGRSKEQLFLTLCADIDMVKTVVEIPQFVYPMLELSLNVPVTIIYQHAKAATSSDKQSIAVRIPSSRWLRGFVARAQLPLASTSANVSGSPTPLSLEHVELSIQESVNVVFEKPIDDAAFQGQASNILRIAGDCLVWVRKGASAEQLDRLL